MSRSGSRYPSAFGHTPSYRSYKTSGYPSALSAQTSASKELLADPILGIRHHHNFADLEAFPSALGTSHMLSSKSNNASTSLSSSKVQSYSSNYTSSAVDGGRPVVEYSNDSTYKASSSGNSGIPRTSYAHSSSAYSSENPYKNRASSYSYNI